MNRGLKISLVVHASLAQKETVGNFRLVCEKLDCALVDFSVLLRTCRLVDLVPGAGFQLLPSFSTLFTQ